MKKTFSLFLIALVFLIAKANADSMTYTWSFASNLSGTASNAQTVPDASLGSAFVGTTYNNTLGTISGWARMASSS